VFRFIIRGRNCSDYIDRCLQSVMQQKNTDWHAHVVLDDPQDDSAGKIKIHPKISLTVNPERMGLAYNIYAFPKTFTETISKEDVLCFLDADDWLSGSALDFVADAYREPKLLLTHGSYIKVSKGRTTKVSRPYKKGANVRTAKWRASHLKTMKVKLFNRIPEECMKDDQGNWLEAASDVALMIPAIEMAGLDRIRWICQHIYMWRDHTPFKTDSGLQKKCEAIARGKRALERVNF